MRTSEVLNKAADLVEKQGWTSGDWGNGDGPLCLEGAIAAVYGVQTDEGRYRAVIGCPARDAVRDYLDGQVPFLWNDSLAHSRVMAMIDSGDLRPIEEKRAQAETEAAAEVIEVLRAAAVIEQAKEQQGAPVAVSA